MEALVILTHDFAAGTTESRASEARESDNGRLVGLGYPLNFGGMPKARLNQFNLVNGIRRDPRSLMAVTVVRKVDALLQSQIFFRRVEKAQRRLQRKAERVAELKAQGNQLRALVLDPATGEYHDRDFLEVKKGDRFYARNPDGGRTTDHDWIARSNGFWAHGYIAGVMVDPVS